MRLRTICGVLTAAGLISAPTAFAQNVSPSGGAAYAAPVQAVKPAPSPPAAGLPLAVGVPPAAAPVVPGAGVPPAPTAIAPAQTGGQVYGVVTPTVAPVVIPGAAAQILPDGTAAAPADAPPAVQAAIFAANQIVGRPYVYGGGHQAFIASGYDCSGTVSFALHGAALLDTPMDSSELMGIGVRGPGKWISIYSNPGHVFMTIAGLRLDTSRAGDPAGLPGPRWRPLLRSHRHFKVRSLPGL